MMWQEPNGDAEQQELYCDSRDCTDLEPPGHCNNSDFVNGGIEQFVYIYGNEWLLKLIMMFCCYPEFFEFLLSAHLWVMVVRYSIDHFYKGLHDDILIF